MGYTVDRLYRRFFRVENQAFRDFFTMTNGISCEKYENRRCSCAKIEGKGKNPQIAGIAGIGIKKIAGIPDLYCSHILYPIIYRVAWVSFRYQKEKKGIQ